MRQRHVEHDFEHELRDAINSVTLDDLRVIRNLSSMPFEYAKTGILSRLGFAYNEETGLSKKGIIEIKYDKIHSDYQYFVGDIEGHVLVGGLVSIAIEKYHDSEEKNSKSTKEKSRVESNCIKHVVEEAKAIA